MTAVVTRAQLLALASTLLITAVPRSLAGAEEISRSSEAFRIDQVSLAAAGPGADLMGVQVRIELLATEARAALNGQSAELLIDDDCVGRRLRLRRVQVYKTPHQGGPATDAGAPADWLPFSSHSYAAQIAEAICARQGDLIVPPTAVPDAAKPPGYPSGPVSSPSPSVGASVQTAEARATPPAATHTSVPPPASDPDPVPAPKPPPFPSTPPAAQPPPPGRILIQYLSTPSEAELERARDNLREQLGEHASRLTFSTARAVVRGVTRYRGRIGLFPGSAEARAFCVTVRRTGFACLVLPDAGNR